MSHPPHCLRVFTAVRDTITKVTLIRKTFNWSGSLAGSVHYHNREHTGMHADMVLELRVLYLAGNRKSTDSHGGKLEQKRLTPQ